MITQLYTELVKIIQSRGFWIFTKPLRIFKHNFTHLLNVKLDKDKVGKLYIRPPS